MYHIIINPASRSGRGRHIWENVVKPALNEKGISYKAYFSEKAGDVAKLASHIASLFEKEADTCRMIILGGDGTVNETLQGLGSFRQVILGYIPTGSSNDLARDMKVSKDPLIALERILSAEENPDRIHLMDKGFMVTDRLKRFFAVSCGLGFDAAVCVEAMQSKIKDTLNHLKLGKLTYLGIALKQIFTARRADCDLYLDHSDTPIHVRKMLFVAAMNHQYEGGGFQFCPGADYNDGELDLCVVGALPRIVILFCLPTAFFGKHFIFPGINRYKAKHIRVEANAPLWLHTDGESLEKTCSLEITCEPGNIRFIS